MQTDSDRERGNDRAVAKGCDGRVDDAEDGVGGCAVAQTIRYHLFDLFVHVEAENVENIRIGEGGGDE